jgi:hypothetical protein
MAESKGFTRDAEIIATYVTHRYYNDLYTIAREKHTEDTRSTSLTEKYASIVAAYMRDIESSQQSPSGPGDILHTTISGLYSYYCRYVSSGSLNEFVIQIVAQVVPDDFRDTLNRAQKDAILRDIVAHSALAIGKRTLSREMLSYIIDRRDDKNGIEILRETGIKVLADYRSSLIAKLYAPRTGASVSRNVASEVYDKLRNELIKVVEECSTLSVENTELRRAYACATAQVKSSSENLAEVRDELDRANHELDSVTEQLERIRKEKVRAIDQTAANDREKFTRENKTTRDELESMRAEFNRAKDDNASMRAELAIAQNKLREYAQSTTTRMEDHEEDNDNDDHHDSHEDDDHHDDNGSHYEDDNDSDEDIASKMRKSAAARRGNK